jgi:hypothetical protein
MSEPRTRSKDKIAGAIQEVVSAMSALNMPPEKRKPTNTEAEYLSEVDAWAFHSYQHLKAAFQYLTEFNAEQQLLDARHFQISKEKIALDKIWMEMPEALREEILKYGMDQRVFGYYGEKKVAELEAAMKKLEDGSWNKTKPVDEIT